MYKICRMLRIVLIITWFLPFLFTNLYAESDPAAQEQSKPELTGGINVSVDIPDVTIYFNGEAEGLAHPDRPLKREYVPAGTVVVTAKTEEFPEQSETVEVSPDKLSEIVFKLKTLPPHIQQMLDQADIFFEQKAFTSPAGENAFEIYQEVLKEYPDNTHAKEKIMEMSRLCKSSGDEAYEQGKYDESQTSYLQYSHILKSAPDFFKDDIYEAKYIENRLKDLEKLTKSPEQLLTDGDLYFQRERYLLPEDENAFEMYKTVIILEPENVHAKEKIYEMLKIYETLGSESEKKSYKKAEANYQNYLFILEYVINTFQDISLKEKFEIVKTKADDFKKRVKAGERLAKEADIHFIAQRYTSPEKKNAFIIYREALESDPTFEYPMQRIIEILELYKNWGNTAFDKRDFKKAKSFYQQYLPVAEYAAKTFGNRSIKRELRQIKTRMDDMDAMGRFLRQGDIYFEKGLYALPEKKNALEMYKRVLTIRKDSRRAISKLHEMMNICYDLGEAAFEDASYEEALRAFRQYAAISSYLTEIKRNTYDERFMKVQEKLKEIKSLIVAEDLKRLQAQLKKKIEIYQALKEKENQDINVSREIVDIMRELVKKLAEIETYYEKIPEKNSELITKITRIKNSRMEMENELAVRESRIF